MPSLPNDFVITVATTNGSGSQSSNNVLVRSLFRMGIPVGGKNLFPSNIAGLPTWFTIRANQNGFTARKRLADIMVAMNSATLTEDLAKVRANGFFIYNSELKLPAEARTDLAYLAVPFRELAAPLNDSVKLQKLLINMIYVGILGQLLKIPKDVIEGVLEHQFGDKASVIDSNRKAIWAGYEYAQKNMSEVALPFYAAEVKDANRNKILIDGNTSAALGAVWGGCTFVSWYPITPSSSLVENFIELAAELRTSHDGKKNYAVVQAEDELASISMVIGAGWAGARAMTATSGPGISLMAEAVGLSYFAEIPAVIWDVQRVGPSTGLPTRTMQGDLQAAYYLSHGDTKHVVLLPGGPDECFEFAQTAFDLAEQLQTTVFVLSDLDIGMNFRAVDKFKNQDKPFVRGKVLNAKKLEELKEFKRYKDVDGDGIGYRTLPGTEHPLAAYFTRGTGHDEASFYSENNETFKSNMLRLNKKFETARTLVPKPILSWSNSSASQKIGIIYFGSTSEAIPEAQDLLLQKSIGANLLRLRALPHSQELVEFLSKNEKVFIVEQNRDGQLLSILRSELPQYAAKFLSVVQFDGLPLAAEEIVEQILKQMPQGAK